jgi:ADP-heptose:LPS heptosyltransferase
VTPAGPPEAARILVIRRDNIGDLILTTPLISALRRARPKAWLGALVNAYNAPVLDGNPDLDAVFRYQKAKHRTAGETAAGVYLRRLALLAQLRLQRIDYAVVAATGETERAMRLARWCGARQIVAFAPGRAGDTHIAALEDGHEVTRVYRLGEPFDVAPSPPPLVLRPDANAVAAAAAKLGAASGPLVALHISARKPSQRWPEGNFIALGRQLIERHGARIALFWAPGDATNPHHPGDDAKAAAVIAALPALPVLPFRTEHLAELIAALSLVDVAILADGGAMHIAAALGKPIVALFGDSDAARWAPWGVTHRLLQHPSRQVADISLTEVLAAFQALLHSGLASAGA